MLRTQFKMELIVYSQDGTYSQSLQCAKNKLEEEEDEYKKSPRLQSVGVNSGGHASLHEMKLHLESYYMVNVLTKAFRGVRGCSNLNAYLRHCLIYLNRLQASV